MMFIIIPVSLMAVSALCVGLILWRKVPYLRKLNVDETSEIPEIPPSYNWRIFMTEMFPELVNLNLSSRLKEYKGIWLSELEKLVRRLRLVSLKIDHSSDALIKKIRRFNRRSQTMPVQTDRRSVSERRQDDLTSVIYPVTVPAAITPAVTMKQEEQRIIIEIAKDPKNAKLYNELSRLYMAMENWNDAKESADAAIELDPGNEELKKLRSHALEKIQTLK